MTDLRHWLEFTVGLMAGDLLVSIVVPANAWTGFVLACGMSAGNALGRWFR